MGNFESKSTPYYSIIDEDVDEVTIQMSSELGSNQRSMSNTSLNSIQKVRINPNNLSFWTVKKANFDNQTHKNAILFEFNNSKIQPKSFNLALNQIKKLKTLRHPNIVKYLYSEESSQISKCLLITESIRPLKVFLDVMSKEQIIRGIFGITNALVFLHDKAFISHNNLNESAIYLNGKQTWKLSDFELSLGFAELNRDNLKQIRELKERNCITPEEEKLEQLDDDSLFSNYPHSIDAYCWAMLLVNILPKKDVHKRARIKSKEASKKGYRNSSYEIDNSISNEDEGEENEMNKEEEVDEDMYDSLDELEVYLNKDPSIRPRLSRALNVKLFNMCKNFGQSEETSVKEARPLTFQSLALSANKEQEQKSEFDPFKLNNLNDIESNWNQLADYMQNITCKSMQKKNTMINEKLIDFLLSPFMFFSPTTCQLLLPSVLTPKNSKNSPLSLNTHLTCLKEDDDQDKLFKEFEPFIELDKYKAFVIPRILNLFTMHSSQIRLVLLKYFPFYVHHINDMDTLKYEILPELLLGLKDDNDQLVSLTFSCLAIMVNLLGSECVVGNKASKMNKIFSENIPKVVVYKDEEKSRSVDGSLKKKEEKIPNRNMKTTTSSDSISKKSLLNRTEDENEASNLATSKSYKTKEKVFSDSMIGLHDQNESNVEEKENFEINAEKSPSLSDEEPLDEWSNDFGWNPVESNATKLNNQYAINAALNVDSSASIISLAGSDITRFERENMSPLMTSQNQTTSVPNKLKYYIKEIDEISSEFDIKSMSIKKRDKPKDDQENLIESFLNEMQPSIQKQESKPVSDSKSQDRNSNITYQSSNLEATLTQTTSNPSWDCEDIVDIDNV